MSVAPARSGATGRVDRLGRRGGSIPGARRPASDRQAYSPRGKGWLITMIVVLRGLAAAMLLAVLAAVPASAATVTVRVEGASATLVRQVSVQPSSSVTVDKSSEGGTTCDGASGGGALELATAGDWGGRADAQGQRVERIKNETYLLGNEFSGRFWALYVNNAPAST